MKFSGALLRSTLLVFFSSVFLLSFSAPLLAASNVSSDLYEKGLTLVQQGHIDEAKEYLDQVVDSDPAHAVKIYSLLANGYMAKRDAAAAIEQYNKARSLDPGNINVLLGLSQAYQVTGNLDKVVDVYKELILREPDKAAYPYNLGSIYLQNKQYGESIEYLEKAASINPKGLQNVDLLLGYANEMLKRYPEAIAAYLKSIENHPDNFRGHYNIGNVYYTTHELENAITHYKIALDLQPDVAEIYANLGYCYFFQDDYSEAQKNFEKALDLKPDLAQGFFGMSLLYKKNNNARSALEYAQNAQKSGLVVSEKYIENLKKDLEEKK